MWKQSAPRMARIRKMDRLDCVSSDTSSSVGATEGGVVALVGGSVAGGSLGSSPQGTLSVGVGFGVPVLLPTVVLVVELEVLETLELESCEVLAPVVVGAKMREELVAKCCELGNADTRPSVTVLFSSVATLDVRNKQRERKGTFTV